MHIFDLPRAMFDGLTSNVSESDRGNAGQLAFGVMRLNGGDEALGVRWQLERPPLGAGYHRAIAEIYRVMDELCAIHDLSLEEGWHSQLGIELMVPAGAFVYEED
jgi:hypothetical protein